VKPVCSGLLSGGGYSIRRHRQNYCSSKCLYQSEQTCFDFITRINLDPEIIITRLWPEFEPDSAYEKVLFPFFQA